MQCHARISVQASDDGGWEVRVFDPATGQPLVRRLRRTANFDFPLPPADDVDALPTGALHRELCQDIDGGLIAEAFGAIVARQPGAGGVARFGEYLFETLLGARAWNLIATAAGERPIELGLTWAHSERAFARLPWEMMRSGGEFLAERPQVALTRRVAGTCNLRLPVITSPPRVLFVIGSRLDDMMIRPGAEYIGLLRALRDAQDLVLGLRTHLLLQATPRKVEQALRWFRPTVVHFICHGSYADGSGALQLMSDEPTRRAYELLTPRGLADMLKVEEEPPQIVVLNACHTGAPDDPGLIDAGRSAAPFASELVSLGVPVVVGMAGEVSDRACRLFSRRFYQALLKGGQIAHAAADGRRAGVLRHDGDPQSSVDWALPTLFIAEGVDDPGLEVSPESNLRVWHEAAANYAPPDYPAYCDRADVLPLYSLLLADSLTQRSALTRQTGIQVLAVGVDQRDDEGTQLGRTWLLREMAAQAARNGHLPCLLEDHQPTNDYFADLLRALRKAGNVTAKQFNLDWQWKYLTGLQQLKPDADLPEDFPAEIREEYEPDKNPLDPAVLAVALRLDLMRLLEAARAARPGEDAAQIRLLLLIDNVHRMHEVAGILLHDLLGDGGLRDVNADVRVVFTYAAKPTRGQEIAVNDIIKPWLDRTNWAESLSLRPFQPPLEDRLAYEFYLLNWKNVEGKREPLVINERADNKDIVQWFLDEMTRIVCGIPSRFKTDAQAHVTTSLHLQPALERMGRPRMLVEADDEAALKFLEPVQRQLGVV